MKCDIRLILGSMIIAAIIISAFFASYISPHDPNEIDLSQRLSPPCFFNETNNVSCTHYLGRDKQGRDVLSRLIHGTRISLTVGISTILISLLIGGLIGLLTGYFGGLFDLILMRIVDIFMAFPGILLAITIAAFLGPSVKNVILALVVTGWIGFARILRAETQSLKEREYVIAAQALGATPWHIIVKHIIPNTLSPMIITATFGLAGTIIAESSLSFLGLGVAQDTPSWGRMLESGTQVLFETPYLSFFPGIAIMLTVLALNFIGDYLREKWDPKS